MKIEKLNNLLQKKYSGKVKANIVDGCVKLTGNLSKWNDVVEAGYLAVDKKLYIGVLNDIECSEYPKVETRMPTVSDKALDKKEIDVLVIGGGISGCSILRELSRYNLSVLLVDKEADVANQTTARNDGEVHPGVDLGPGSKKQYYVLKGNAMYDKITSELDVPFRRIGQYALFENILLKPIIQLFAKKRTKQGCPTKVISGKELRKREPNLDSKAKFALYNPTAGVTSPYGLTIAYAENAIDNGAMISLKTAVLGMDIRDNKIVGVKTNRGTIKPKLVINCAGTFSDDIASMANDRFFTIHPRKGTNAILDKKAAYQINGISSIRHLIEPHHTKGGGIMQTVDGNILIGPTALEVPFKEDYSTSQDAIDTIIKKQTITSPLLKRSDIITYFSGIRAATYEEDFYIEKGRKTKNIIHVAGIQSPGITTAPAIAIDIAKMASDMLGAKEKKDFNPIRHAVPRLKDMDLKTRNEYIKKNSDYGVIVCRCEEISKGEIIDALNSKLCVPTLDGVKRRVRPGMGRCQGGFCSPIVAQLIAEHEGIKLSEVKKNSDGSFISFGPLKGGKQNG